MKNMLTRFFLMLFVVLLGGQGVLNAHPYQVHNGYALEKNAESLALQFDFGFSQDYDASYFKSIPFRTQTEKQNEKFVVTDNEGDDEELVSYKKYLEINNYFTTALYAQTLGYSHRYVKESLPYYSRPLSYFSSYRKYIVFRVIRL